MLPVLSAMRPTMSGPTNELDCRKRMGRQLRKHTMDNEHVPCP